MSLGNDQERRQALGQFLRTLRDRRKPQDLGIATTRRRRAPGLLREEVASEAGLSVTWYTWLEQGRPINPSRQALNGLVRALCMSDAERAHLFRLMEPAPGLIAPAEAPAPLLALVQALSPAPAYLIDEQWNVLAANPQAEALFGPFAPGDAITGNVLSRLLLDPGWHDLFVDHQEVTIAAVEQFRLMRAGRPPDDLVHRLLEQSALFRSVWADHGVREPVSWRKRLRLADGRIGVFDYHSLVPQGYDGRYGISIYLPSPDSDLVHRP